MPAHLTVAVMQHGGSQQHSARPVRINECMAGVPNQTEVVHKALLCQLTSLSRCCSMAAASSAAQGMSGSPAAKTPGARWAYLAAHAKAHRPFLKQ